jgi:large subunit ribosomal protein L35
MPKMKPHTATGKRIRVTGSGKLMFQHAGLRKKLEKKPSRHTRRLSGLGEVASVDAKRIKKLLGR